MSAFGHSRIGRSLLAAVAVVLIGAAPTSAHSDPEPREVPEHLEDMPERLEQALNEMLDRMKPVLEDMFDLIGVMEQIDSPANYGQPRILPNGDILIPRSPDAPDWPPDEQEPDFEPKEPLQQKLDPDEATRI